MKNQLATIAKHASLEAARRYAMKPGSPPGINAHSCAPDAAIDFLSSMGYNPTDFDEEAVAQAQCLLEAGYCIGSEAADDRWKGNAEEWSADHDALAAKLAEAQRDTDQIGFDFQLEFAAKERRIAELEAQLAEQRELVNNFRTQVAKKLGLQRAVDRAAKDLEIALHNAK